MHPDQLQDILDDAIRSVLDMDAFNAEVEAEQADAQHFEGVRRTIHAVLKTTDLELGRGE